MGCLSTGNRTSGPADLGEPGGLTTKPRKRTCQRAGNIEREALRPNMQHNPGAMWDHGESRGELFRFGKSRTFLGMSPDAISTRVRIQVGVRVRNGMTPS
jgi:hypothetical protein